MSAIISFGNNIDFVQNVSCHAETKFTKGGTTTLFERRRFTVVAVDTHPPLLFFCISEAASALNNRRPESICEKFMANLRRFMFTKEIVEWGSGNAFLGTLCFIMSVQEICEK